MPKLEQFKIEIGIPGIGKVEGTWSPDKSEQQAAWELYVELITRIAVIELEPGTGLLREALASLYTLFGTTRTILKHYGPTLAQPKEGATLSFGYLAVTILNHLLRPVLAEWHPKLYEYEISRSPNVSVTAHEQAWEHNARLRKIIRTTQEALLEYANILAGVAHISPLVRSTRPTAPL